jgi:cytochrome b subunit of formate dehydrogenase
MFAQAGWAQAVIGLMGGIELARGLHRLAAIGLLLETAIHLAGVGYRMYVLRVRATMLLGRGDVREAIGALRYNLRLADAPPPAGRYTFEEKVEYWAFVWGTMVMAVTGFLMLNPIATTRLLPGEVIPTAKTIHGYEAVLAVLAVAVWHHYSVHLRRFNKSMFTGTLTEHEMQEDHPLELAELKAAGGEPAPSARDQNKRRWIYYPVCTVVTAGLAATVLTFVRLETTAIETVPPRLIAEAQARAFEPVPATPLPMPTPSPIPAHLEPIWQGNVALLFERSCTVCHGGIAGLDYTSYQTAMAGGLDGAVILPGDVENSPVIQKIGDGTHSGKLSVDELNVVKAWIAGGAAEK